jgi:hypothetical protein
MINILFVIEIVITDMEEHFIHHLKSFWETKENTIASLSETIFPIDCLLNIKVLSNRDWFLQKITGMKMWLHLPTYVGSEWRPNRYPDSITVVLFRYQKYRISFFHFLMVNSRWGRMWEHMSEKHYVTADHQKLKIVE